MATEKDTLREIGVQSNLSTRALNILMRKEFESIYDLVEYYKKHGDFLSIRNCGESSSRELIELSKKYINGSINHVSNKIEEVEPPNPTFERLFILQFKVLFKRLSTEAKDFVRSKIGVNYPSCPITNC